MRRLIVLAVAIALVACSTSTTEPQARTSASTLRSTELRANDLISCSVYFGRDCIVHDTLIAPPPCGTKNCY